MSSRKAIVGAIAVSIAFVMELTLVPLFLPEIQAEFGLSVAELAWFFNAYGIAVAIGVLLGGWLGDNFDTKKVFGLGVLLFACGSAAVALSHNYQVITFARAMQGFGGGIFSPLVPILLANASPLKPGRILILWGSVTGYVAALGPVLYSGVLYGLGWHFGFAMFAFVAMAALFVVQQADIPPDDAQAANSQTDQKRLYRPQSMWLMFGYVFCTYGAISFYFFSIPIRLSESGFEVVAIGLTLSTMWLSFSIASALLRNFVDAPHVRALLMIAPVLIALGVGIAFNFDSFALLVISAVSVGCGLACSNAPSTLLILQFAPKGMRALSASLDISFARIGGVLTIFALAHALAGYAILAISVLSLAALFMAYQATQNLAKQAATDHQEAR